MIQLDADAFGSPNALAILALVCWPFLVLAVYGSRRATSSVATTTAWMMMLPVLFLPANIALKFPGVPGLDKHRVSALAIALALALFHPRPGGEWLRAHRFPRLVLLGLISGAALTVLGNRETLTYGPTVLPGLSDYDLLSIVGSLFLDVYLPFAIGERVFRTERDLRELLRVLSLGALIYAPLFLLELRLSPQLNNWVYGYHQHQFVQSVRGGGYRPVVFMNHGLSVAMFLLSASIAAVALRRGGVSVRPSAGARGLLGTGLILLSKSVGAVVYALAALPAQLRLSTRTIGRIVLLVCILVSSYPVSRAIELFPAKDVADFFGQFSQERAASLWFRFDMEEKLLARASEKPLFGWGTWGRNHVYAPWGRNLTVVDGYWVMVLGAFGAVGFVGVFALLLVPLLRFVRRRPRLPERAQILVGGLGLAIALYTVDLLPNSRSDNLSVAYAGALFTLSDTLCRKGRERRPNHARAAAAPGQRPSARSAEPSPGNPRRPDRSGPEGERA